MTPASTTPTPTTEAESLRDALATIDAAKEYLARVAVRSSGFRLNPASRSSANSMVWHLGLARDCLAPLLAKNATLAAEVETVRRERDEALRLSGQELHDALWSCLQIEAGIGPIAANHTARVVIERFIAPLRARAAASPTLARERGEAVERLTTLRPINEYHEDRGPVLWWAPPVKEPPYVGNPLWDDFPGYHTHWSPLPQVNEPALSASGALTGER